MRRSLRTAAAVLCLGLLNGCYVCVHRAPADVAASYGKALARAERAGETARRKGRDPRRMKVWVYEPDEERIVRVSMPMWLIRRILEADGPEEDDPDLARFGLTLQKLQEGGPGVLLTFEDTEGERALIWLE